MEKVEALSGFFPLQHNPGQPVVFLPDGGKILLRDGEGQLGIADHRLHRNLGEAQLHHMQHIL